MYEKVVMRLQFDIKTIILNFYNHQILIISSIIILD